MNQKLVIRLVGAAVAVFVIAYGGSPLLAARGLIQAAKAGDAAGIERRVDFPAFRASLKDELGQRMITELQGKRSKSDRGLAALGMIFGQAVVSGVVDSVITPSTIATVVQEGQVPRPSLKARDAEAEPGLAKKKSRVRQSWTYRDLNTFAVTLTRDDKPEERVALLMTRRNLFGWKLSGVDLSGPE